MTYGIAPLYEVRILSMPIEKFAEIAIDGAIWLTGEYLSQGRQINPTFFLNPTYIHKPRHREVAIAALDRANQRLRHRIFVEGFRKLPDSGTHGTFRRSADDALGNAGSGVSNGMGAPSRPDTKCSSVAFSLRSVANELLSNPSDPR
jgi:hypothetical protein